MTGAYFSVVGIDPSLTGCGIATIQEDGGEREIILKTLGRKGKAGETLAQRQERIRTLVTDITDIIRTLDVYPDVVSIEGPSHGSVSGSHHDRSGLWWVLVLELSENLGLDVVEITPSQVKTYATGKGNAAKDEVMAAAIRRYPQAPISNNNESDAFTLAAMAARLIGEPIEETLPQTHLRTMEKLSRP